MIKQPLQTKILNEEKIKDNFELIANEICRYSSQMGTKYPRYSPPGQHIYDGYMKGRNKHSIFFAATRTQELKQRINQMKNKGIIWQLAY